MMARRAIVGLVLALGCAGPPRADDSRPRADTDAREEERASAPAREPVATPAPSQAERRAAEAQREEDRRRYREYLAGWQAERERLAGRDDLVMEWLERGIAHRRAAVSLMEEGRLASVRLGDMEAAGLGDRDEAKILRATIARLDREAGAASASADEAEAVVSALRAADGSEELGAVVERALSEQRATRAGSP